MKYVFLFITFLGICFTTSASAISGNKLLEQCNQDSEPLLFGVCYGYVIGITDFMSNLLESGLIKNVSYKLCIDGVTNKQLVDTVIKHLQEHPETRHEPADAIMISVLGKSFGCKQN